MTSLELINSTDEKTGVKLINILKEAKRQNPDFLNSTNTLICETDLSFNRKWGFGSSSTLISLISKWAHVNPYDLLRNTFSGSGYDIACADSNMPLLFHLENQQPKIREIEFTLCYEDKLYFVYLGEKQRSDKEVSRFNKETKLSQDDIDYASFLTDQFMSANSQIILNELIIEHENFVGEIIKRKAVKHERFSDFNGEIKSLGAWGGDFVLVSSCMSEEDTIAYFKNKQLDTILRYKDIVLK